MKKLNKKKISEYGGMETYGSKREQRKHEKAEGKTMEKKEGMKAKMRSAIVKKAKKGEDIGKPGKGFAKVAAKAAKKYGSKEVGKKVAAAAMWKAKGLKKK